MSDRTPEEIREEAAHILNSAVFQDAVRAVKESALRDLLAAKGLDGDTIRRECADRINAVDAVLAEVEAQFHASGAALKPRGQVA